MYNALRRMWLTSRISARIKQIAPLDYWFSIKYTWIGNHVTVKQAEDSTGCAFLGLDEFTTDIHNSIRKLIELRPNGRSLYSENGHMTAIMYVRPHHQSVVIHLGNGISVEFANGKARKYTL